MIVDPKTFRFEKPRGFLVLDGVNGAGKSTLQSRIVDYIQQRSTQRVVATREPGGTSLGMNLRKILLEDKDSQVTAEAEVFLFAADRFMHVGQVIRPALDSSKLVVCDRYCYSTLAFQGYGRGVSLQFVEELNQLATGGLIPDLVLLLDLEPEIGLARALKRTQAQGADNFESESLDFHLRIRQGFLNIARNYREPFVLVDAGAEPQEVFDFCRPLIDAWLAALRK